MNTNAKEVLVGGLMGTVAVFAIFLKALFADFSTEALLEALIEISGIGVTLLIFFSFLKGKMPVKDFHKRFKIKSNDWVESSQGLISKMEEVTAKDVIDEDKEDKNMKPKEDFLRYYMLVDFNSYFLNSNVNEIKKGEFIRLPKLKAENYQNGITLRFYMNKSTMLNRLRAEKIDHDTVASEKLVEGLSSSIAKMLTRKFPNIEHSKTKHLGKLKYETTLELKGDFTQPENMDKLFETLDYIILMYAIAA